jgi:FMN phosphatase YigB (HAD superfamily)
MRIAIVHYHLRPGGVTRVIEETSAALTALGIKNTVLADGVPGLGYDGDCDPETLATRLRAAARNALGSAPDAWIFHNPTLGKNRAIPSVIERFAFEGEAVLLHIHDLAEDGRPANFANIPDAARLHITAPRVHHAFINARDKSRFIQAGLLEERTHLLPNPVALDPWLGLEVPVRRRDILSPPTSPRPEPLVFYPVRGIRRKNLGELCLLAALAPPGTRFAISRAPENPDEITTHDFWRNFATAHQLPVWFDVTDRIAPSPDQAANFQTWQCAATHWVSTSVAEGFGQTLAEAAACGKPLIARALDAGFQPTNRRGIYQEIQIAGEAQDFAALDEPAQAEIIRLLLASPDFAESIRIDDQSIRTWLRQQLENRQPPPPDPQLAAHAPENVASTLITILKSIIRQPPAAPEFLPPKKLAELYRAAPPLVTHPRLPARRAFPRAVIFDVYGTLLDAPSGGVRPNPSIDPSIINFLENNYQITMSGSPTSALAELVAREHAASSEVFPEIDLVALWAELLGLPVDDRMVILVAEIEDLWHPATPMPGAAQMLRRLAAADIPCGLLSNAQANVWRQLGELAPCFASDLCVFSHQFLRAKPSPALFDEIVSRLARRGIAPHEVWFIGNDPTNDIIPANTAGFHTALYGNADSSAADLHLASWADLAIT